MTKLKNLKLKVAGTGPLLNKLKDKSSGNVEFLGFINGEELSTVIENSSFVVIPSEWYENNPLTLIEAYAHGKPVIGSKIGGIPEIIDEGKTGYIFNSGDKISLERTIKKALMNTEEQYKILSDNARKYAEYHFSPDNYYNELMDIYRLTIENYENI
jgi:glycosyltransferase involved in cell wall biosynthesis